MRELPPTASEVLRQVRKAHDPSAADVARSLSRLQASLSFGVDGVQAATQVAQPAAAATPHVGGALLTVKAIKLSVLAVALGGSLTAAMLGSRAPAAPARTESELAAAQTSTVRPREAAPEPAVQRDELELAPNATAPATDDFVAQRGVPMDAPSARVTHEAERAARAEKTAGAQVHAQRKARALPRVVARAALPVEVPSLGQAAEPAADVQVMPPAKVAPSELDLISRAATNLRDGQLRRALSLLDQHRALYPTGLLHTEQQGLRVLALCALGQVEQAREVRRGFLRDAGRTPLAARVRRACAEPGQP